MLYATVLNLKFELTLIKQKKKLEYLKVELFQTF